MEISFAIDIGNDEKQGDQTKGRHTQIYNIPADDRSENICQVGKRGHITIDQSNVRIITQDHILKDRTEDSLKDSTHTNKCNNKPCWSCKESSTITENHSNDTNTY